MVNAGDLQFAASTHSQTIQRAIDAAVTDPDRNVTWREDAVRMTRNRPLPITFDEA